MPQEVLPTTARAIALLLSSNPAIQDVHPGVLHQLLEFSHRYTYQVLSDALVYSEHAGRAGKLELDDVMLAVQARVGWELGGRVPKEYTLSLATQTNAVPLPPVPEVFGVRLPPPKDRLTSVDFDLLPNKPPPGVKVFDEETFEETDDEEPMPDALDEDDEDDEMEELDVTTEATKDNIPQGAMDDEDDNLDADALFDAEDDDVPTDVNVPTASTARPPTQRMLVEDDDYD